MCSPCFDIPLNQLDEPLFTEEEANEYIEAVFYGVITKNALSPTYHKQHTELLRKPVEDNLLFTGSEFKQRIGLSLRENVYEFSAAKQYQQAREMSALITEDITLSEFKRKALDVFGTFNETYLKTEFNTAIAASQGAASFADAVENATEFPYIQYKTQNDGRVRPPHAALHNIVKPVLDPFWNNYWGDNGWNCRCFQVQLQRGKVTPNNEINFEEINKGVPPLFRRNAAKTGEIYDKKKHPYWEVERGDSQFRDQNFGLSRG